MISDIWIPRSDIRVPISDIRYLYPTSNIYIRRPISISDVRYLSDVRYTIPYLRDSARARARGRARARARDRARVRVRVMARARAMARAGISDVGIIYWTSDIDIGRQIDIGHQI